MARSSENMAILSSITQHFPLDVLISQSPFRSDQRSESVPIHSRCQRRSESYNQQNSTQVTSLPLSQLFVVTSKAENSLGSVSWSIPSSFLTHRLDLGKETVSFYIEVKPSEDESPELQLLSIR